GHVLERLRAGLARLAVLRAFLVHGARGNLLGRLLGLAVLLVAFLDVLVLAFALRAPGLGHGGLRQKIRLPRPNTTSRPMRKMMPMIQRMIFIAGLLADGGASAEHAAAGAR